MTHEHVWCVRDAQGVLRGVGRDRDSAALDCATTRVPVENWKRLKATAKSSGGFRIAEVPLVCAKVQEVLDAAAEWQAVAVEVGRLKSPFDMTEDQRRAWANAQRRLNYAVKEARRRT